MHRSLSRIVSLILTMILLFSLTLQVYADSASVIVTSGEGGTASVKGTDANMKVEIGLTVTISAAPKTGYRFDHWQIVSGNVDLPDDTKAEQEILVEEDLELKAHFVPNIYTVTVDLLDQDGGSFSFYERTFAPGDPVSVTAYPYEGFAFVRWDTEDVEVGDKATELVLSFTMPNQDVTLLAEFQPIKYRFRVITGAGGRVAVDGRNPNRNGEYEFSFGEEIEILAEPEDNFLFGGWTATNGASFSAPESPSTTLICPSSDFTVRAQFASAIKELNITSTEGGSVSPQEGTLRFGVDCIMELLAIPEEGYVFSHWECSSADGKFSNPKEASATFTMPDTDCTVTAVFTKGGYKLTVLATVGGRVDEASAGNYEMGTQVPVSATPEEGYRFARWDYNVEGVLWDEKSAQTVVTMPGEDVKITAVFSLIAGAGVESPDDPDAPVRNSFPWIALVLVFLFSAIAIALIVVRERFNLSYGYLIRKWFRTLLGKDAEE